MKLKPRDALGTAIDRVARDSIFGTSDDFPRLLELDLDQVEPRSDQPRRHFDSAALEELATSMARVRLIHPILVREVTGVAGRYEIVSGERRWRAARMLGWPTIYAILTSGDVDEIALIENLQRQDLNALEEAVALARLQEKHGYTQEEVGAAIGKSQGQVSALLRLLTLHPTIREQYPTSDKQVSRSLLIELATVDDKDQQLALWARAREEGLTIRAIRQIKAAPPRTVAASEAKGTAPNVAKALTGVVRVVRELETLRESEVDITAEDRSRLRKALRQALNILDSI